MYPITLKSRINSPHVIEAILILPEYARGGIFNSISNAEADAINFYRAEAGDTFKNIYNHPTIVKYKNKELKITWVEGNLDHHKVNEYLPFLKFEILPALIIRDNFNSAVWHGSGKIKNSRINIIKILNDKLNPPLEEDNNDTIPQEEDQVDTNVEANQKGLPLLLIAGGLLYYKMNTK